MGAWDKVLAIEDSGWCKEVVKIKRLISPSELRLDSYQSKYQYHWMCDLYSLRFSYLSWQFYLLVYPDVYLCIASPFASTLGGGKVKVIIHHSLTKPCAFSKFTWYTRVCYITTAQKY